jgi:hypothetical protein
MKTLNRYRSCRFGRALRAYDTAFEPIACLVDLLADARHWCDRHGASYVELDRTAHRHYLEEVAAAPRRKP